MQRQQARMELDRPELRNTAELLRRELRDISHHAKLHIRSTHRLLRRRIGQRRQLVHGPLDPRYLDFAKIIADSGAHLLGLIDDILTMARVSPGDLELAVREVPIADIVTSSLDMVRLPAAEAQVLFTSEIDPHLDTVRADPARLRHVLVNILSNAVKFTDPQGEVSLTVRREPDGGFALRVADTGIGIAADKMALALEPFGQVEQGLARRHPGIGLGLPLAQRLVELHGGTMEIASQPGQGTTVTARFPQMQD